MFNTQIVHWTARTAWVKSSSSFSLVKLVPMNHFHAHEDTSQVLLLFIHGIRDGERIQVERSVEVQR